MKRFKSTNVFIKLLAVLTCCSLLIFIPIGPVMADTVTIILEVDNPLMVVNGSRQEIDPGRGTAPIIEHSRMLLPIASIIGAIGGTVDWDPSGGANGKVTIQALNKTIELWINSSSAKVNGKWAPELDAAPKIYNGRTMIPLSFVAQSLGADIHWYDTPPSASIYFW
ncbi:MAG: stalk domain-containing protein [Syntrophomonas sp.]